jgi:hypothetical protein
MKGLWGNRSPLATVFKAIEASVIFGSAVIISGILLKQTAAKILGKPSSASLCLFEEIPPERRPCVANQTQPLPNRSPVLIGAQEPWRWQRHGGQRAPTGITPGDTTSSRVRRFLVIIKPVMTRAESGAGERLPGEAVSFYETAEVIRQACPLLPNRTNGRRKNKPQATKDARNPCASIQFHVYSHPYASEMLAVYHTSTSITDAREALPFRSLPKRMSGELRIPESPARFAPGRCEATASPQCEAWLTELHELHGYR